MSKPIRGSGQNGDPDEQTKSPFSYDEAMRRIFYLSLFGCLVVIGFGLTESTQPGIAIAIGLMIALAAMVAAGLVGFIFGVPFTRDNSSSPPASRGDASDSDSISRYRANTSLEQISEWLTKMLVGVGLVEIKSIPHELRRLSEFFAQGLGCGSGCSKATEGFVLGSMVFFGVCGFLFGFLWARIYLPRWFSDADKELATKISRFELDARAITLARQAIHRSPDEKPVSDAQLKKAIASASSFTKTSIFEEAKQAAADKKSENYDIKNAGAQSVFKALIADDTANRSHENHAQLGYAMGRARPPDLAGADEALTEAIRRRDALNVKGWRYYEFRRASDRIRRDENFKRERKSDEGAQKAISADLAAASKEPEKWKTWLDDHKEVGDWMKLNEVNIAPAG